MLCKIIRYIPEVERERSRTRFFITGYGSVLLQQVVLCCFPLFSFTAAVLTLLGIGVGYSKCVSDGAYNCWLLTNLLGVYSVCSRKAL